MKKKRPLSFATTLMQKEWIKPFCRGADRAGISDDSLFFMLRDFCVSQEIPLDEVILSPSTIKKIRKEVEAEAATRIMVGKNQQFAFNGQDNINPVTCSMA